MTRIFLLSTLVVLGIGLGSCTTSKSLTKKGQQLESAGLIEEAANNYYQALRKKKTNVDAQVGMKTAGQLVLNQKLSEFSKNKNFGEPKDAVYSYLNAKKYADMISAVGVKLSIAELYEQDYESAKDTYLHELYDEGTELLEKGEFAKAEDNFDEIAKFDKDFKDSQSLGDVAYLEPRYIAAKEALELGNYRTAYDKLDEVIRRNANYKDSGDLKEQALEQGRFSVAVLPFANATNESNLDLKINAYTLEALTSINDPFLRIVDRENLQTILDEQTLGLSGVIDEETAVNVGELLGAQALLSGTVLSYDKRQGTTTRKKKQGYEQYKVKKYNASTETYDYETKYRKTNYYELRQENSSSISFQYKITSLKTGEVLFSKIVDRDVSDRVHYVEYDGDAKSLYPAKESGVNLSNAARNELRNLTRARRDIKTTTELGNDLFQDVSSEMRGSINNMLRDEIK